MMKQNVLSVRLTLVVFFTLFLCELAIAGVPVPWGAKLIRDDTAVVGSEERRIITYETKAGKKELLNYYLREMPNRGYSLFMNGEQNLIFKKAEDLVIVIVPPSQDSKTRFMISAVSMKPALASANPDNAGSNCESLPLVPLYPGARCVNSMHLKSAESKTAAYSTEDPSGVVVNFYRGQMPRYGWQMDKEMNLGDIMSKSTQGKQLENMAAIQDIYENARAMYFINQAGKSCSVFVMSNPVNKKGTLVTINYADKAAQQ